MKINYKTLCYYNTEAKTARHIEIYIIKIIMMKKIFLFGLDHKVILNLIKTVAYFFLLSKAEISFVDF